MRATPRRQADPLLTAITTDPTPLDILLALMRHKWSSGDADGAQAIAKVLAPYVHPRRKTSATPATTPTELHRLTDEELRIRLAETPRGAGDPPDDPSQPG